MNKCYIVGRLTKAPEAKTTPNGVSVTTFSVAVNRRMNREETDFLNIVTWRGLADNCAKYLVQGQRVAIVGEIRTRTYDAKDGTKRYVTEIQADDVEFLDKPTGAAPGNNRQVSNAPNREDAPAAGSAFGGDGGDDLFASEMSDVLVDDDDLPF